MRLCCAVDAASSEIMVLRQRVALLEATLASNGLPIPEDTSGFSPAVGAGTMTVAGPTMDRPAYMAAGSSGATARRATMVGRAVSPGGAPGVGAAWVDTDEIPLPVPSSLGAELAADGDPVRSTATFSLPRFLSSLLESFSELTHGSLLMIVSIFISY